MKNLDLTCPKASYGPDMKIRCAEDGDLCGYQHYKICKGWSVLTEGAGSCTRRIEKKPAPVKTTTTTKKKTEAKKK